MLNKTYIGKLSRLLEDDETPRETNEDSHSERTPVEADQRSEIGNSTAEYIVRNNERTVSGYQGTSLDTPALGKETDAFPRIDINVNAYQ